MNPKQETKMVADHLKNLRNHPMISSIDFESSYRIRFNHMNDSMKKSYNSEIHIFTKDFESANDIRKFISWISYALKNDAWKKSVDETIYYYGEYEGIKVTLFVRTVSKPLKRLTILQTIAGCELVERYSTYTSKSYTCERK